MPRMGTNTRSFSIKGASANETALSSRKMRMDAAAAVCMEHKKEKQKEETSSTNRFMVVHFLSSIKYITEQGFADKNLEKFKKCARMAEGFDFFLYL